MVKSVINFYRTGNEWGGFSNFFKAEILIGGKTWPTTEHYFQGKKKKQRNNFIFNYIFY
jgi:predicted NAD-dependent protein-ADP-ribosyltransferase YbiA (DUF1768 family)